MSHRTSALFVSLVCIVVAVALSAAPGARADDPAVAPTPPMGFNDWNAYGCNVSASLIETQARYLHSSGMERDGYRYVNIDDCWEAPQRTADGALQPDPTKFPAGIAALASYVHHLGLKLGIYLDAGTSTCAGYPGSFGHAAQDAQTIASWGVDYLKYDQCNIPFSDFPGETHQQVDTTLYTQMSHALRATGRPIVFSMCNGTDPAAYPWRWGAKVSNLWRTTPDIRDNFASTLANFEGNVELWRYAHPGAFNDPDMLEIGNGGQTLTEYRTQFSLWAEMAAPLIAGTNLTTLTRAERAIYENRRIIAVDQDPLGRQGRLVADSYGLWVLSKRLEGGAHAVALFNSTATPQVITTSAHAIGARPAAAYRLENLWDGRVTRSGGVISAFVPAEGTIMERVSALRPGRARRLTAPSTVVSLAPTAYVVAPGASLQSQVTLTDRSGVPLHHVTFTVTPPAGWAPARPETMHVVLLRPGRSFSRRVEFVAPASVASPFTTAMIRAAAHADRSGAVRAWTTTATEAVTVASPLQPPLTDVGVGLLSPVMVAQAGQEFAIAAPGTGITPATSTSQGVQPASDSFGAIVDPGKAGSDSTAQVTVTAQTGSAERPTGSAGLIERPSLTTGFAQSDEGAALSVSTGGAVTLVWNTSGGQFVDSSISAPAPVSLPVTLRLQRAGATVIGSYSTDGGLSWTTVGTGTLAPGVAAGYLDYGGALDLGLFHDSGTAGWYTTADFSDLTVTP